MNIKKFQEYFGQKGYAVAGSAACGVENGVPVAVQWAAASAWRVVFSVDGSRWKELKQEWNARLGRLGKSAAAGRLLAVSMTVKNASFDDDYRRLVQLSTEFFREKNVSPIDQCCFCGQQGCDTLVYYGGQYAPVHNACCEQAAGSAMEQARKNDREGSYLLGVLGGILGAVAGIIPSVLTIFFAEKIYSILFALIPICIYFGYRLFRGKLSRASLVITILLTIAGVFLLQVVMLVIIFATELQVPVGNVVAVLPELLAAGEIWEAMAGDLVQELLFAGLGLWIAWGYISRTNSSKISDMQAQMATRRPIAPAAPQERQGE